jgi:hypothetical protein
MRARVQRLAVVDTPARIEALEAARGDLLEAGNVAALELEVGEPALVDVQLAPDTN